MSVATRRPRLSIDLSDFSGGLNVRDGYAEVAPNELRDGTLNATLDERSALGTRKGCPVSTDFPNLPGNASNVYFSSILNLMIVQVGVGVYKCAPGGGSWTQIATQTNSKPIAVTEWGAVLIYTHPDDGTYYYDGATLTQASTVVKGGCIAIWQNKAWVGSAINSSLWWSAPGAVTFTPATDVVSVAERDNRPLTALFGGPTLIAFKEGSHYRINDSTTGSYTTVDWNAGAVGPRAVVGGTAPQASGLIQEGGIFFWGLDGLYAGDGLRPAILVGDKLRPRFIDYAKINKTTKPLISGGIDKGRIYFAFPKTSTTKPDTILEYHPRDRWLVEHQIGTANPVAFASYSTATRQVTVIADNASGTRLIELNTSDTRTDYDGSAVALTVKTGFVTLDEGRLARLRKAVFTLSASAASAVTFAASYIDSYLGTELSSGLTFGAKTLPAGTSETTWNATALAPAYSFTLTASGVFVTLRRILLTAYRAEA